MRTIAGMLAVALSAAVAAPSFAATISGTYYEDEQFGGSGKCQTADGAGSTARICTIAFPLSSAIAGKLLIVQSVSCTGIAPTIQWGTIAIADDARELNLRRVQGLSLNGIQSLQNFSWRQDLAMKVAGGPPRNVILTMGSDTSSFWTNIRCLITGEIATQ